MPRAGKIPSEFESDSDNVWMVDMKLANDEDLRLKHSGDKIERAEGRSECQAPSAKRLGRRGDCN